MTAGRGIIHQEMPRGDSEGRMHGFQLWANLPAHQKMIDPRYQEIKAADITSVTDDDGTIARIICGNLWGKRGPIDGIAADPLYVDIFVPPNRKRSIPIETSHQSFAYVFAGGGKFSNASDATNRSLVLFDRGDEVVVQAGEEGMRFLLVSGKPLQEPVAWRGPIVMNTQDELRQAFRELEQGTFLKSR